MVRKLSFFILILVLLNSACAKASQTSQPDCEDPLILDGDNPYQVGQTVYVTHWVPLVSDMNFGARNLNSGTKVTVAKVIGPEMDVKFADGSVLTNQYWPIFAAAKYGNYPCVELDNQTPYKVGQTVYVSPELADYLKPIKLSNGDVIKMYPELKPGESVQIVLIWEKQLVVQSESGEKLEFYHYTNFDTKPRYEPLPMSMPLPTSEVPPTESFWQESTDSLNG